MEFNPNARLDTSQVIDKRRHPASYRASAIPGQEQLYKDWYNRLRNEHPDWPPEMINAHARENAMQNRIPPPPGGGTITDITTPTKGYYPDNSNPTKGNYNPFIIGDRTFRIPAKEWSKGMAQRANTLRQRYKEGGWESVRDMLVRLGYSADIPIPGDGQDAFVTSAAQAFLRKGTNNRNQWNKWFEKKYGNPSAPTSPGTDIPKDTKNADGTPVYPGDPNAPSDTTAPPGNGGIQVDPVTGALLGDVAAQLQNFNMIDPSLYARSSVNAQYNPVISEIMRQIKQGDRQTLQNQQDIQDWYKVATDQYATSADAINKYRAGAVQSAQGAMGSIAEVAGGAAGAAVANPMAAALGFVNDQGASDAAFTRRMGDVTGMARNEQLTREQARASVGRNTLMSDLTSTKKAKGDALTAAREQAVGVRLEQLQAYINMALGLGNFDLSKQELGLKAQQTAAGDPLGDELTRAQIDKTRVETDAIISDIINPDGTGVAPFNSLTAGDFTDLQSALLTGVDPAKATPLSLANLLGDRLRLTSNGAWDPKQNPEVRAWRNRLLYSMFPKKLVDKMLAANPGLR